MTVGVQRILIIGEQCTTTLDHNYMKKTCIALISFCVFVCSCSKHEVTETPVVFRFVLLDAENNNIFSDGDVTVSINKNGSMKLFNRVELVSLSDKFGAITSTRKYGGKALLIKPDFDVVYQFKKNGLDLGSLSFKGSMPENIIFDGRTPPTKIDSTVFPFVQILFKSN